METIKKSKTKVTEAIIIVDLKAFVCQNHCETLNRIHSSMMPLSLTRFITLLMTLAAMLGQSVLANGYAMAAMEDIPMSEHHQVVQTATMSVEHVSTSPSCHSMQSDENAINVANGQHNQCCQNSAGCSLDCTHCLTISFAGNVLALSLALSPIEYTQIEPTWTPQVRSIELDELYRPPIA